MRKSRCVALVHFIKCSLWITVFVVRVSCIIEAGSVGGQNNPGEITTARIGKSSSMMTPNSTGKRKKQRDLDSCDGGKKDGYYPNFASDCTSYYFCAAGYQITYVCPPGKRYNGDECVEDYDCPALGLNSCVNLPNGYYPLGAQNPQKYFYCFNKAKVIELSCDPGKIFEAHWKKCILKKEVEKISPGDTNCLRKRNGFYPDLESGCVKYFYCIGGVKTELECKEGLLFNGDLCVQKSRFACPNPNENSISDMGSTNPPN